MMFLSSIVQMMISDVQVFHSLSALVELGDRNQWDDRNKLVIEEYQNVYLITVTEIINC